VCLGCSSAGIRFTQRLFPDASKRTLQAIIRGKADPLSVINTDGWRGYDLLPMSRTT
jgi:transposase